MIDVKPTLNLISHFCFLRFLSLFSCPSFFLFFACFHFFSCVTPSPSLPSFLLPLTWATVSAPSFRSLFPNELGADFTLTVVLKPTSTLPLGLLSAAVAARICLSASCHACSSIGSPVAWDETFTLLLLISYLKTKRLARCYTTVQGCSQKKEAE